MGDDADPQINIVTRFVTDSSGADRAVEDVGRIGSATQQMGGQAAEATEKGSRLMEDLGNRRGSQRAAMELFEVFRGGGATIEGVTGLLRMFLLTADGLAPELVVLGAVALALTGLVAKHSDVKAKTDDAKKSEDDLAKASEDAAERRIAAIGRVLDAFTGELEAEERFNESLDRQEQYNQQAVEDTNKLIEARAKLAVAELEHERQEQLGKATSKDQVDAINERFKNLIESTQSQSQADVLANKITASASEIGSKQGDQRRVQDELSSATDELQSHRDATAQAQQQATDLGVLPDAAGSYKEVRKQLAADVNELVEEVKAHPLSVDLRDQLKEAGAKSRAANAADDYTEGLPKWQEKLGPTIDKLTAKSDELATSIEKLTADNQALQIDQAIAATQAKTKALTVQQGDADKQAKEAYDIREAKRKADTENWQKELGEHDIDPTIKALLQRNIAANAIASDQDNLKTNSKTLTDAEKIELQGRIRAEQTGERVESDNDQPRPKGKAAVPPGVDPTSYDQLQTSVDKAAAILAQPGHAKLAASFDKLVDLQAKANFIIENFAASADTRLTTMAQNISDLEKKVANNSNHG